MQTHRIYCNRSIGRELVQTTGLIALMTFGLGTSAMAEEIVPAEYQGVWAAARNCSDNFQTVVSNAVNREIAACRVTRVVSSDLLAESHTSTIDLNCGGAPSREIWHGEHAEGADYLVIVQLQPGAAAKPSVDLYKRCPEIPLGEIRLSEIPGNPAVETAAEEKVAPPSRSAQIVRQRPYPHSRAIRMRKRKPQ